MSDTTEKAAEWWSDPDRTVSGTQWLEIPGAVENMNHRATGDPEMDWITHSAGLLAKFAKPIKALSLGFGFGVIERVLRRCDYCQLIHLPGAREVHGNQFASGLQTLITSKC